MVEMRDGIHLATDVHRPGARAASSRPGAFRRSSASRRTTRPSGATRRSPTSSSRTATRSCSRTSATGTAATARATTSTARRAHRPGRLRHDRVDRGPAVVERAHRHGRLVVRGDHAGPRGARAAAAPRRDLAGRRRRPTPFQHQTREGGAMQLHMFWALFIHAQTRRTCGRPGTRARGLGRPQATCASSSGSSPWRKGELALQHMPTLEQALLELHDARRLRRLVGAGGERLHGPLRPSTRTFPARSRPAGTTASRTRTPSTSPRWQEKNESPQRLIVGPWSHVGMRGDATFTLDVDFGRDSSVGRAALLRGAARVLRRFLPDERRTSRSTSRRCGSSSWAAARGRKTELGQARPRRPLARRAGVAARACRADDLPPARRRLALARGAGDDEPRRFTYDPRGSGADDRRQLLRRRRASAGRARAWSRCGCGCSTRRSCCATS